MKWGVCPPLSLSWETHRDTKHVPGHRVPGVGRCAVAVLLCTVTGGQQTGLRVKTLHAGTVHARRVQDVVIVS